jgi:hypothetical protein
VRPRLRRSDPLKQSRLFAVVLRTDRVRVQHACPEAIRIASVVLGKTGIRTRRLAMGTGTASSGGGLPSDPERSWASALAPRQERSSTPTCGILQRGFRFASGDKLAELSQAALAQTEAQTGFANARHVYQAKA